MRHAPPALPLTSPADSQVSSGERAGQSEPRRRTPRGNLRSLAMCFFLVFFCVCFPLVFFPLYLMADRWRGDIRRLFFLTPAAFVSKVSRPASGGYWVKTCPRVFILSVGGTWIVGGGAVGGRVEATQRQRICDTLSVLMRPFVGVSEEHLSPPPNQAIPPPPPAPIPPTSQSELSTESWTCRQIRRCGRCQMSNELLSSGMSWCGNQVTQEDVRMLDAAGKLVILGKFNYIQCFL